MTGYQEILTDPSYAGQIITFTFPHIGNVGTNVEDIETTTPAARGVVLRMDPTDPSNFRATQHLDAWLKSYDLPGIRSEEHTSELQSLMRISYAVFCLKKKKKRPISTYTRTHKPQHNTHP